MKVAPLISIVLLALSLTGGTQAEPAARHIAPATIELAQCDVNSPAPCGINGKDKVAEVDLHALPSADPKQQQAADPATPVPEPKTFVMLMLGLVVLGFASRRRTSEKFRKD